MVDQLEDVDPDDLTPAQWTALTDLLVMEQGERERFLGHIELSTAAWRFLRPAVEHADLRSAWPALHADLRLCLAQQWVVDNPDDISDGGYHRAEVAAGLACVEPAHELWRHFARVHLHTLREMLPSSRAWGIGDRTRLVGPDLEMLYLHDTSDMPDGVRHPGDMRRVVPLLMRWTGERWLVCNIGSARTPAPGWPPRL